MSSLLHQSNMESWAKLARLWSVSVIVLHCTRKTRFADLFSVKQSLLLEELLAVSLFVCCVCLSLVCSVFPSVSRNGEFLIQNDLTLLSSDTLFTQQCYSVAQTGEYEMASGFFSLTCTCNIFIHMYKLCMILGHLLSHCWSWADQQ